MAIQKLKKRTRLVNPERRARKVSGARGKRGPRKHRANPTELITLGAVVNPHRGPVMKKTKKKSAAKKAARKKNPVIVYRPVAKKKANHGRRRHSNPEILGPAKTMLESGAYALGGLVATRQIPQLILKEKNSGWMGYLANAATAIAVAMAAGKFVGPRAGNAALIGGGAYLVDRVLTEKVSPVGQYLALSGVGDFKAASTMGRVKPGYFPLPVQRDRSGNPIIPQAIVDAVKAQLPAPAAAAATISKISGVSRKMAPRFAA